MLDISIIIPIYNVEKYLRECLDSVKKVADKLHVEVIMIDDGSTDGSSVIAKEYAEKYSEFFYNRQENKGLGSARNYGLTLATGKYIWFVDSDDIVDANVIYRMFLLAERNQSDLTICDAARIKDKKISAADTYLCTFHNLTDIVTHITKHPALVHDTMAWNKLIRRSYHEEHKFAFPEGYLYEDIPWSIPLHYYANHVSILNEVGYYWRIRTGDSRSITQQKSEKKNLTDKIEMFQRVFDFLDEVVKDENIHIMLEVRQWGFDYIGYLNLLSVMKTEDALEYVAALAEFIEKNMTAKGYESLPLIYQQIVHDIRKHDLDHLIRANNYRKANYQNAPIIETDNGMELLVSDEIFTIENRDAQKEFDLKPARCQIDYIELKDTDLIIKGHVYYRKVNVEEGQQIYGAYLFETVSGKRKDISIQPIKCGWLTEEQGITINHDDYRTYHYNYDGTGFCMKINLAELEDVAVVGDVYKVMLMQENRLVSSSRILRGIKKSEEFLCASKKMRIKIMTDKRETLQLLILKPEAKKEKWWKCFLN